MLISSHRKLLSSKAMVVQEAFGRSNRSLTACVSFRGERACLSRRSVMTYPDNDRVASPDDPSHRDGHWQHGPVSLLSSLSLASLAYGATQATDMPTLISTIWQPLAAGSVSMIIRRQQQISPTTVILLTWLRPRSPLPFPQQQARAAHPHARRRRNFFPHSIHFLPSCIRTPVFLQ